MFLKWRSGFRIMRRRRQKTNSDGVATQAKSGLEWGTRWNIPTQAKTGLEWDTRRNIPTQAKSRLEWGTGRDTPLKPTQAKTGLEWATYPIHPIVALLRRS